MRMNRRLAALAALALAGCSPSNNTGTGTDPGADAGVSSSQRLTINASTGLYLVDFHASDEGPLTGNVVVKLDGQDAENADVKINGKPLVPWRIGGLVAKSTYTADLANPPTVGSDLKVTIEASLSGQSTSLTVDCPPDLTVNVSPAAGSVLAAGSPVTASWTGNIWVNSASGLNGPTVSLRGYSAVDKTIDWGSQPAFATLQSGATSGTVTANSTGSPGYVLQVSVPGLYRKELKSSAICYRARRFTYVK